MVSIDRGDSHFADAGTWQKACLHMGIFFDWAVRNGLGSADHTVHRERIRHTPTAYVLSACDAKLWPEDFCVPETVIRQLYSTYLSRFGGDVSYRESASQDTIDAVETFLNHEARRLAKTNQALNDKLSPKQNEPETTPPETVVHAKFGKGIVVMRADERALIRFDSGEDRMILTRFLTFGD